MCFNPIISIRPAAILHKMTKQICGHSRNKKVQYHHFSSHSGVQTVSPQVTLIHPLGGRLTLLSAWPAINSVALTGWR